MTAAIIILIVTLFVSFLSIKTDLNFFLNLWPNRIFDFWRPFTYSFVHNDINHLLSNSIFYCIGFLGFFQKFSNIDFIKFYFISAILSVIPYTIKNINNEVATLSGNSAVVFSIFYGFIFVDPFAIWGLFGYGLPAYTFGTLHLFLSLYGTKNSKISVISHISGLVIGIIYVKFFL
jgi:membrane associated rhomboid family serine protease